MKHGEIVSPVHCIAVYNAADWRVVSGANEGDQLSFAEELELDDVYMLDADARRQPISIHRTADDVYRLAETSENGTTGAVVHLDCTLSLMGFDGRVTEALVLVEVNGNGHVLNVYLLPLAQLTVKTDYRLVGIDTENMAQTFAQAACVSFTRGTRITLGTGEQRCVEDLQIGDSILTRNGGIQKIRWIGQSTHRAVGDFAPVRIAAGTLNNTHDLIVSPDHHLFVYQRTDHLGVGRAEVMIKARHLVNGSSVTFLKGGFVDYFQLLFDNHQIIYAEGIAAESMLVDDRTAPMLSSDVLNRVSSTDMHHRELSDLGVKKALLDRPDAVDVLRRASKG